MNYSGAMQFLNKLGQFGMNPGLDVTRLLAATVGNPQNNLRFIHVAGTNGKGSTCAMLEGIYRAAGLRIGLFTSPHLVSFAERIQTGRKPISQEDVARIVTELASIIQLHHTNPSPTFFETVTVLALQYFAEQRCDLVIWETGLGGRLDATNIVTPLASVITNIGLDHQQWLGGTYDQIATEKAGIIKNGVPVITGAEPAHGLEVIVQTAASRSAPLTVVTTADADSGLLGRLNLSLRGQHQRRNAAVAVATVQALQSQLPVAPEVISRSLAEVHWPGRLQRIVTANRRTVLLDGAHNSDGARALCVALEGESSSERPTLILGILADKDWECVAKTLAPIARKIITVPVDSPRTLSPERLQPICRAANPAAVVECCPSLATALSSASGDPFVVITGSLYLVGEAMLLLHVSPETPLDERSLNDWSGIPQAR